MRRPWPLLALLGCGPKEAATQLAADPSTRAEAAEQAEQAGGSVQKGQLAATMKNHSSLAQSTRNAVIDGNLEKARRTAKTIDFMAPEGELPPAWKPFLADTKMAALLVDRSDDLVAAGRNVGHLARSCATCHTGLGLGPSVPADSVPDGAPKGQGAMAAKEWAADWMWVGMVSPSDEAFTRGAQTLLELSIPGGGEATRELEAEFRLYAQQAVDATDSEERALAYGALIGTCARCHEAAKGR